MYTCTDQLNRTVTITSFPPKRIVSLVPSQTELLFDLGLDDRVIGITKFCIHPENWFKNKTKIGGTKKVNIEKIKSLRPDLIIANKEENVKEEIELLAKFAPVWVSDVHNLDTALSMIKAIGTLTGRAENAKTISEQIEVGFSTIQIPKNIIQVLYLIWKDPYMTIGGDTFINDMLNRCGLRNIFEKENRYPQLTINQNFKEAPQIIILSSEPYPFKEKDIKSVEQLFQNKKVVLADGAMFSWYGSRLLYAPTYCNKLLDSFKNSGF